MAIAKVQNKGIQSVGSVTSLALAFDSAVTNNNLLVVGVVRSLSNGAIAAGDTTDTLGNTYAQAVIRQQGFYSSCALHYVVTTGGANTVTYTPTASDYCSLEITEWSGIVTTSPLDVTGSNAQGSSTAPATSNLVTTQADELIVGLMANRSSPTTTTAGASYTLLDKDDAGSAGANFNAEHKIVSATGTYTADWTLAAARDCSTVAASFKMDTGGGGGFQAAWAKNSNVFL